MEAIRTLLEQQQLMALFLTIAIGYLAGEINVKGFSLGVGAVLFVALAIGWFAPKSAPPAMVGTLGLALFLYAVGVQYGKQFFQGFASASGRKSNALALTAVLLSGALTIAFMEVFGVELGHAMGLFAGSGTSTPALQAAIATLRSDDPAVGYSVSYPFGVAGPILLLYVSFLVLKPSIEAAARSSLEVIEIELGNTAPPGTTLRELAATLPAGVQIAAVRREGRNEAVTPGARVDANDVVLAVGPDKAVLEQAARALGSSAPGRFVGDRRDLDYMRAFVSRTAIAGKTLDVLKLPGARPAVVAQVRRGDTDILPRADLMLELGDRVGVLAYRGDFPALRRFFGDSIKSTAEVSYISIGIAMALGFALGAIQIPLPAIGKFTLGLSGVLTVALVLGRLERTRGIIWAVPLSANVVLRNLGLTLFLAQVGMSSGPTFAATVSDTGSLMLALGAAATLALILPILAIGLFVFRMPFDHVAGVVAGVCGNPAVLAYSNSLVPTERPDLAYAMIFPGMTLVKILFLNIVIALS